MSDAVEAKRYLEVLDEKLKARNPEITLWEQYFEGMHRLQFATSRFRSIFGNLFREFADNWCPLVVEASVERLHINGFRAGTEANEADLQATKIWRDNCLDADYRIAHIEAVKLAHAYVLVDAENKAPETDSPLITIEHPAQAIVMHHPASRRLRLAGLKEWIDENDRLCATLYMADTIYRFEGNEKSGQEEQRSIGWSGLQTGTDYLQSPSSQVGHGIEWVPRQGVPFEVENALKVVPLVPLCNNPTLKGGRSDIAVVIPLQDAVNKMVADMMIASEFASFAQRWATGLEVPKDPQTGRALNNQEFISGPGRVWIAEHPDAKFGQFEASNLQNYVHAVEMLIQHVAALTRTPPHYLLGQALALDTVVPTPTGRRTMEELLVGDLVFDEQGQPQTVEEAFPVLLGEPCYRLTFDDGSEIVADADHKWVTSHYAKPRAARDVPRETSVVTTREIRNTLKIPGGKDKTAHHFIETCSSRHYIVGCEPVASVPVRCIRVSGPSKLFLVTDACIATHNSGSFPSGDSLTATETGLVAKVNSKQTDFQVTWNEVMRLAFRAKGSEQANEPIETIWGDPEQRIYSQRVDGALKLSTLGVPQDAIFEEIGKTPQEIARWHAMKRAMAEAEPGSAEAAEHSTLFAIPPTPQEQEAQKPGPQGPEGNLVEEQAITQAARIARIND
jgi:hypothetical protein